MRIVLDTNVLVSGAFFGGFPGRVVDACVQGRVELVVTPQIWTEYVRVGEEFTRSHPTPLFSQLLAHLATCAKVIKAAPLDTPVCRDSHDDMFVACSLASGADFIVSGDKDLLDVRVKAIVNVVAPREFLSRLKKASR